jgi:hypothetical protein
MSLFTHTISVGGNTTTVMPAMVTAGLRRNRRHSWAPVGPVEQRGNAKIGDIRCAM